MTAHATLPAVTAPAVDEYLAEAIADELTLARLLGWAHISPPTTITPNCWIFGTHLLARGHDHRNASAPCPRWRRDWEGAGRLIAACDLCMITCDKRVAVGAGAGSAFTASAEFSDHPTKDDAIRYAMCKAAVSHLTNFKTGAAPRNAPHDAAA